LDPFYAYFSELVHLHGHRAVIPNDQVFVRFELNFLTIPGETFFLYPWFLKRFAVDMNYSIADGNFFTR
jgi:hypothetical protein